MVLLLILHFDEVLNLSVKTPNLLQYAFLCFIFECGK
jgi:hypothetical protein